MSNKSEYKGRATVSLDSEKLFTAIGLLPDEDVTMAEKQSRQGEHVVQISMSDCTGKLAPPPRIHAKPTWRRLSAIAGVTAAGLVLAIGAAAVFGVFGDFVGLELIPRASATAPTPCGSFEPAKEPPYDSLTELEALWIFSPAYSYSIHHAGIGYCNINDVYVYTHNEDSAWLTIDEENLWNPDTTRRIEATTSNETALASSRHVPGLMVTHDAHGKLGVTDDDGILRLPFVFDLIKLIDDGSAFAGCLASDDGDRMWYGIISIPEPLTEADIQEREQQRLTAQGRITAYALSIPEVDIERIAALFARGYA